LKIEGELLLGTEEGEEMVNERVFEKEWKIHETSQAESFGMTSRVSSLKSHAVVFDD
jgi:hypothetical protein